MPARANLLPLLALVGLLICNSGCSGSKDDDEDGTWSARGTLNEAVWGLGRHEGTIYAGGDFRSAASGAATLPGGIARWTGTSWESVGGGVTGGPCAHFLSRPEGLYVGGNYTAAGGIAATNIARWDGTQWHAVGASFFTGPVDGLCVHQGTLHAIARVADWVNADSILAAWNGSTWSTVATTSGGSAFAVTVVGNDLYIAGRFTAVEGVAAKAVARLRAGTWAPLGSGLGSGGTYTHVKKLIGYGGGIVAGGEFDATGDGSVVLNHIGHWDGTAWRSLAGGATTGPGGPDIANIYSLAIHQGRLVAGGKWSAIGGVTSGAIASWDGTTWSPLGSGLRRPASWASVLALLPVGSELWVGGGFTEAGGAPAQMMAVWTTEGPTGNG